MPLGPSEYYGTRRSSFFPSLFLAVSELLEWPLARRFGPSYQITRIGTQMVLKWGRASTSSRRHYPRWLAATLVRLRHGSLFVPAATTALLLVEQCGSAALRSLVVRWTLLQLFIPA